MFNDSTCLQKDTIIPNYTLDSLPSVVLTENFTTNTINVVIDSLNVSRDTSSFQMNSLCRPQEERFALHINTPDTTLCPEDSVYISAVSAATSVRWYLNKIDKEPEFFGKTILADSAAMYIAFVEGTCSRPPSIDTVNISYYPDPNLKIVADKDTFYVEDTLSLRATSNQVRNYAVNWFVNDHFINEGDSLNYYLPQEGIYDVSVKYTGPGGCILNRKKTFEVNKQYLKIPNIFTPNGDGINDIFKPAFDYRFHLDISIYNRYGKLVATPQNSVWDGTTNSGAMAAEGVYFYVIKIPYNGQMHKGSVTLMR